MTAVRCRGRRHLSVVYGASRSFRMVAEEQVSLLRFWTRHEADSNLTMQRLLEIELVRKGGARPAVFTAAEKAALRADAEWAIADLARRRSELRSGLEKRSGARIVVETAPGAEPLRLGRFSPLDLFVLGNGEVVHCNFTQRRTLP